MAQHDDSDPQAWLDALNALVQMGLVEVVSIAEDGEPSYCLASRIRDVRISILITPSASKESAARKGSTPRRP